MSKNVLLLSILSTVSSQGTLYVSKNMSNWANYGKECIPVTPNVEAAVGNSPNVYDVDNLRIDIPDNEGVWVGYYQVVRVFEYIGCVEFLKLFSIDQPFVKIKGDPGHCFPGCGESTIIGVTKTRCYCLGDDLNLTEHTQAECTDKCDNPIVACGQDKTPSQYSYISIYNINPQITATSIFTSLTVQPSGKKKKDCLTLTPNVPKKFLWEQCSVSLIAMCLYDDRVETISCDGVSKYCSWIDAAITCLHNGRFPTSYSNSKHVNSDAGSPLWTGLFKTYVTYKHNTAVPTDRRHDKKYFGYLTKETETSYKLRFAETDSEKRVLCTHDKNKIKPGFVSSKASQLSSVPTEMTNFQNTGNTDEDSFGIYIAVAVSVSVILIAAVTVLLICFVRRRRKAKSKECFRSCDNATYRTNEDCDNATYRTNEDCDNATYRTNEDCDNATYRTNEDDNDNPGVAIQGQNNYFIMEPGQKGNDNMNETYDTAAEETVYDRTDVRRDSVTVKPENVYNQLDTGKDTTYDKAFAGREHKTVFPKEKDIDGACIYESSTVVTKPVCFDGKADSIYNNSDDFDNSEYQHLGSNVKQSKTDNIYGIRGTERKADLLCEDQSTYNCINTDSAKFVKTDNTYSSMGAN